VPVRCEDALELISAAADGELADGPTLDRLTEHVDGCSDCAGFDRTITRVRSQLRFEAVETVPDVAPRVLSKLPPAGPTNRRETVGVAAAAAVVGLVVGATFAGLAREPQAPAAADLSEEVLAAQHDIAALDVEFELTERGRPRASDPDRERVFDGHLAYQAPESVALTLTETEPVGHPAEGGVQLVVADEQWSLDAVRSCSTCPTGVSDWHQTVTGREPFADAAPVPLELVTAVDSFGLAGSLPRLGEDTIAGRPAVGVRVSAAQVAGFLEALSMGPNDLRAVYPTDPVEVWLERDHLVPLAVEVRAGDSVERAQWAAGQGYADEPGEPVLSFTVRTVRINGDPPSLPPVAVAPNDPDERGQAQARDDGFEPGDASIVPEPGSLPDGLRPYVDGLVTTPGGPDVGVRSWTDGRAWVKVRATDQWDQPRLFGSLGSAVRPVDLGAAGQGYVSTDGRTVALHAGGLDLVVTGSLPTAQLRAIAADLGVAGQPIPAGWPEAATASLSAAQAALPGLLTPNDPQGFAPPAVRVAGDTVIQVYAGPGDRGFVLTQSTTPDLPPPADGDSLGVEVRGTRGRYSVAQGELEWTERDTSLSLSSATLSLTELVAVAEGLAPP
jgi:hypothetical protein